jgi:hypothetical protein
MSIQIDTLGEIQQLKKNDIIFNPATKESFRIDQICDDFFILSEETEHRAIRLIYFSRLILEKWQIVKTNVQPQTSC